MLAVPVVTARAALQGLAALGHDPVALARAAGLPSAAAEEEPPPPDVVVPEGTFGRVWRLAAESDPRPELPVLAGLAVPQGAFGLLDYAVMSAGTVGAALDALSRFFRLASAASALAPDPASGWVHLRNDPPADYDDVADAFTLAAVVGRFRDRLPSIRVRRVDLTFPVAPTAEPFERAFGTPVRLGRPTSGLRLDPAAWTLALPGADASLHRTLSVVAGGTDVAAVLGTPVGSGPAADHVASVVALTLAAGPPRVATVARALGLSARTLQRRLADEGTSFEAVLDRVRSGEAPRLLRARGAPVSEVAALLGYAEAASFTRAFRRWYGTTPSRWRRDGRAGDP